MYELYYSLIILLFFYGLYKINSVYANVSYIVYVFNSVYIYILHDYYMYHYIYKFIVFHCIATIKYNKKRGYVFFGV